MARDVELYGPGEVIGIEGRAIIRTDPRPWITNFEPNYLAQIEFYEEDFPWRYTPAAADASKLAAAAMDRARGPEGHGRFGDHRIPGRQGRRGAAVAVHLGQGLHAFPPADQLWAWAHVHVNRGLGATRR